MAFSVLRGFLFFFFCIYSICFVLSDTVSFFTRFFAIYSIEISHLDILKSILEKVKREETQEKEEKLSCLRLG